MEGAAAMNVFGYLERVDQDVTLAINSLYSPVSDFIWQVFSNREIWIVMYLIVLVMLFVRLGWKKALVVLGFTILLITALDQTANLVKYAVARLRPCWDEYMMDNGLHCLEGRGGFYGFFSGHASLSMAFAVMSYKCFRLDESHTYRAYGAWIFLWAVLVGVSRIFVSKHYLGDVLVGMLVGMLFALLFAWICRLTVQKLRL